MASEPNSSESSSSELFESSIPLRTKANARIFSVDLSTVPSPQLAQLKNQLTQDLSQLTTSFAQLRAAQAKFRECINNIRDGVAAKKEGFTPIPQRASKPRRFLDGSTSLTKKMACLVHALLYARH